MIQNAFTKFSNDYGKFVFSLRFNNIVCAFSIMYLVFPAFSNFSGISFSQKFLKFLNSHGPFSVGLFYYYTMLPLPYLFLLFQSLSFMSMFNIASELMIIILLFVALFSLSIYRYYQLNLRYNLQSDKSQRLLEPPVWYLVRLLHWLGITQPVETVLLVFIL